MNIIDINDNNKYFYSSDHIIAFPSTNSKDSGKLTSEENIKDIVTRITELNYRLTNSSFIVSCNKNGTISISPGSANIRGYKIITSEDASLDFSKEDDGKYYVYIALYKDSNNTGNLHGDEYDISNNVDRFLGSYVSYDNTFDKELFKERLFLGTVVKSGNNITFIINPHINCRIDPDSVYVDFYGNPDRTYHGTYTLGEYVNLTDDIFVSKFGDSVYGSLYFYGNSYTKGYTDNYPLEVNQGSIEIPDHGQGIIYKSKSKSDKLQLSAIDGNSGLHIDSGSYNSDIKYDGSNKTLKLVASNVINEATDRIEIINSPTNLDNKSGIKIISGNNNIYFESNEHYNAKINLPNMTMKLSADTIYLSPRESDNCSIKDLSIKTNKFNTVLYPEINYCNNDFIIRHSDTEECAYIKTDYTLYIDSIGFFRGDRPNTDTASILEIKNSFKGKSILRLETLSNEFSVIGSTITSKSLIVGPEDYNITDSNEEKSVLTKTYLSTGDINCRGNIEARGTIRGSKVYNAVYNDYADFIKKDKSYTYEPGDIIAKKPGSDEYTLATHDNKRLVVGVYSDNYGHILGGDNLENMEDNKENYIPLGVAGNVDVKITGTISEGDLITVSYIPGVGKRVANITSSIGCIVGKALESKNYDDIGKVKMQIMLL